MIIAFVIFIFRCSILWLIQTFPLEDYEQVITALQMPLEGFSQPFIINYLNKIVLAGFALSALLIPTFRKILEILSIKKRILAFIALILWNIVTTYCEIPIAKYWEYYSTDDSELELYHSSFWTNNYTDIDSVKIDSLTSPRNLILIIMESMENWPDSLIPELRYLSSNELSFFSGTILEGGMDINGSTDTHSSTVSKITGVPMLYNRHVKSETPLVRIKSIYDILHKFGYSNYFIKGSDANFAGTKPFLANHGMDKVYDMYDFQDEWNTNSIFRNICSFTTGITDSRLYQISKNILDSISKVPFTLTITTVDTHFPYGFYDESCIEKPNSNKEDDIFRATIKCASRQVYEFTEWAKKQDFYNNTEIIIVGDHLFMGKTMTEGRNRRWVNIFINAATQPSRKNRLFTSLDFAPTILESMGLSLENHRMGLGASLFSTEKTLLEKMGYKDLNKEIKFLSRSTEYNLLNQTLKN